MANEHSLYTPKSSLYSPKASLFSHGFVVQDPNELLTEAGFYLTAEDGAILTTERHITVP